MELVNELYVYGERTGSVRTGRRADVDTPLVVDRSETRIVLREAVEALVRLLAPFAPHMAEELWEQLGHQGGIVSAGWPVYSAEVARAEEVVLPVQVNGKVRARIAVPADATDDDVRAAALGHPQVQAHTTGKSVEKVVIVKGRLVGLVVK
jgi:leucyl-tRNA synthetase